MSQEVSAVKRSVISKVRSVILQSTWLVILKLVMLKTLEKTQSIYFFGFLDCYIGQSIYGDGICHESVGRISVEKKQIFMSKNNEIVTCPFFQYFIIVKN